jgi:hypothetical protein
MDIEWVRKMVEWLWGFPLKWFQLEDLMTLLTGGILSIMYPTDHGKSMLCEMSVVLSICDNPDRRQIYVPAAKETASDFLVTCAVHLEHASERYPDVLPLVRHDEHGTPVCGAGFYVKGADRRNKNRSIMAFTLGGKVKQGRRGRTHVDDVETEKEGQYSVAREQLGIRIASTLRTLEDRPDALWALFGTPYAPNSVYYSIPEKLEALGKGYTVIRRPVVDEETGVALWPERHHKVQLHRLTMQPGEYDAAYRLIRPLQHGKPTEDEIRRIPKDYFGWLEDEQMARQWLADVMTTTYTRRYPSSFNEVRKRVAFLMQGLRFYIGWDPAARGAFGLVLDAVLDQNWWILRARSNAGDIYDQLAILEPWWRAFPSATIVHEKNAQQWVFSDILSNLLPDAHLEPHYTKTATDADEDVGVPSVLKLAKGLNNYLHLPYADAQTREMSDAVLAEIRGWPGVHGHMLPAIWFTTVYDGQGRRARAKRGPARQNEAAGYEMFKVTPRMGRIARDAWRGGR